jgi:hypothetical protein
VNAEPTPTGSVELRDYLLVFKRQLALIVAITLLGLHLYSLVDLDRADPFPVGSAATS